MADFMNTMMEVVLKPLGIKTAIEVIVLASTAIYIYFKFFDRS